MTVKREDVRVLKLLNGMELLCEVDEDEFEVGAYFINIKNPIQVVLIPDRNTKDVQVAFAPFTGIADKSVEWYPINIAQVLSYYKPTSQFVDQYVSTFSSLLVPQSPSLLVP